MRDLNFGQERDIKSVVLRSRAAVTKVSYRHIGVGIKKLVRMGFGDRLGAALPTGQM